MAFLSEKTFFKDEIEKVRSVEQKQAIVASILLFTFFILWGIFESSALDRELKYYEKQGYETSEFISWEHYKDERMESDSYELVQVSKAQLREKAVEISALLGECVISVDRCKGILWTLDAKQMGDKTLIFYWKAK